jgi:hypothetical protein
MKHDEYTDNDRELAGFSRENPFRVPEGYFERLPQAVQEKRAQKRRSVLTAILPLLKKPGYALAAIAVLALGFTLLLKQPQKSSLSEAGHELLSSPEYLEQIDEETLIEHVYTDTKDQHENKPIEDYLIDNNLDLTHFTDENI